MSECKKRVGKGAVTFPCIVDIPAGEFEHRGPCAARENESTMIVRERWEAENRQPKPLRESLTTFQTERRSGTLYEGATPPPGFESFPSHPRDWHPHTDVEQNLWVWVAELEKWVPCFIDDVEDDGPPMFTMEREITRGGGVTRALSVTMSRSLARQLGVIEPPVEVSPPVDLERPASATDEPPPVEGDGDMWAEIIADMQARHQHGLEEYGTPLQRWNGRNAENDAYQEALDLVCYMHQMRTEREVIRTLFAVIFHGTVHAPTSRDQDEVAEAMNSLASLLGVVPKESHAQ